MMHIIFSIPFGADTNNEIISGSFFLGNFEWTKINAKVHVI